MNKLLLVGGVVFALSVSGAARAQMTGQSHPEMLSAPDPGISDAEAPVVPAPVAKPSPATPATAYAAPAAPYADAHAPVMPATGSLTACDTAAPSRAASVPAPVIAAVAADDMRTVPDTDFGVVTRVPYRAGELPEGTILRTHLDEAISNMTARPGTPFSAKLILDIVQDGRVLIPAGSSIRGRVTKATENRRIEGHAKLRLRPEEIVFPDGTRLDLHAQVVATDSFTQTKTNGEGTILSRDDTRKNWEIAGVTTGAGAISGAVIGGGVGAVVGTAVGAGVGAGHFVMARPVAELPRSSTLVFQLTEPLATSQLHD